MLIKKFFLKDYLNIMKPTFSSSSKTNSQITTNNKKGYIYLKSTNKNIFCTLIDAQNKKVKTSCSLKVPHYENEFNERINIRKRGILLGELFKKKTLELGFQEVAFFVDSRSIKGRNGFFIGFGKKEIKTSFIRLSKGYPHNGCRPSKKGRKKVRTKVRTKLKK